MPAPALSLHGLRKTFGDVVAVNDLDLEVLRGASLVQVAPELAIVGAWMVGSVVLALKFFRWQ